MSGDGDRPDGDRLDDERSDGEARVAAAMARLGLSGVVTRHARASSLAEAAAMRGVAPSHLVKTMVVRRGSGDYLLVLVPGDRTISWPKLRALLGVSRLSMPDADRALAVTGYERGTITPLGAHGDLPVIADSRVAGEISIGAGAHGAGVLLQAADLLAALGAQQADVAEPQG